VALNEDDEVIRFGTCKRSAAKLVSDLAGFGAHVGRFLDAHPRYRAWRVEKVAIAPVIDAGTRRAIEDRGVLTQDLGDLVADPP
jgi:uncharacterized protein